MEKKSLKQFDKDLGWSTKIYVLLALCVIVGSFLFNAWETSWSLTMIMAVTVILFVESLTLSIHRHPKTWRAIGWLVALLVLMLLVLGLSG